MLPLLPLPPLLLLLSMCSTGQKKRFPSTRSQCCHQAVIHICIMEAQPGASWELINGPTDTIYED
ncbi:hypothetical protein INR49_012652 [Caranx melampygus]|nr:hypothetical protein INR49_012652 [Caranx melampygus]